MSGDEQVEGSEKDTAVSDQERGGEDGEFGGTLFWTWSFFVARDLAWRHGPASGCLVRTSRSSPLRVLYGVTLRTKQVSALACPLKQYAAEVVSCSVIDRLA